MATPFENTESVKPTDNAGAELSNDIKAEDYQAVFNRGDQDSDDQDFGITETEFNFDDAPDPYKSNENGPGGDTAVVQVAALHGGQAEATLMRDGSQTETTVEGDKPDGDKANAETETKTEVTSEKPVDPGKVGQFDFAEHAISMFPELDGNGNGNLSNAELKKAMLDPKYKGKDAQTVAALFELNRDGKLNRMSRGDGVGTSVADLQEMDRQAEDSMAAFRAKSARKFVNSDGGEDKRLSKEEIDTILKDNNDLSERDRINLTFLQENFDLIDNDGDGLDDTEIKKFGDKSFESEGMKASIEAESLISNVHREQISTHPRSLYANEANPLESIQDPLAIRQSGSSCYFEASVLAVAQAEPETIKNMIAENDDGTITVTFPGDPDNPITIEPPTEAEMGKYHDSSRAGRWGNYLQKAHGKYLQEGYTRRHFKDFDSGDIPAEGAEGGEARLGQTMKLLTGRDYDRDGFSVTPLLSSQNLDLASSERELRGKLAENLNGLPKAPVIASTIEPAHVYAITGFDAKGPDGGTIEFIDPLGGGKDYMSVQQALKKFNAISYSEKRPFA